MLGEGSVGAMLEMNLREVPAITAEEQNPNDARRA